MKKEFTCSEVTQLLIDEATKQFSPLWIVDNDKYHNLCRLCKSLDLHLEKWGVEAYEVEVDDITMEIKITLECKNQISCILESMIYFAINHNEKYVSRINEDNLNELKFAFPGIWKRNSEREVRA